MAGFWVYEPMLRRQAKACSFELARPDPIQFMAFPVQFSAGLKELTLPMPRCFMENKQSTSHRDRNTAKFCNMLQSPSTCNPKAKLQLPIYSMYGIFNHIWGIFRAHVGKYSIHGAYGYFHELSFSAPPRITKSAQSASSLRSRTTKLHEIGPTTPCGLRAEISADRDAGVCT